MSLVILLSFLFISPQIHAQGWRLLTRIGGYVDAYVYDESIRTVYVKTSQDVVYESSDGAKTWKPFGSIPMADEEDRARKIFAENGCFHWWVWTNGGFHYFRTSNKGTSWDELSLNGVPDIGNMSYCAPLAALITSTHLSRDHGTTWKPILTDSVVHKIAGIAGSPRPGECYCRDTKAGLFAKTTDYGDTWTYVDTTGMRNPAGARLTVSPFNPDLLFSAGSYPGGSDYLYRSENGGISWSLVVPNMFGLGMTITSETMVFIASDTILLNVRARNDTIRRLYRSVDAGITWTLIKTPEDFYFISVHENVIYAYNDFTENLYSSLPDPISWTFLSQVEIPDKFIIELGGQISNLIYLDSDNFISYKSLSGPHYVSSNSGKTWSELNVANSGIAQQGQLSLVPADTTILIVGSRKSVDGGKTWSDWGSTPQYQLQSFLATDPVRDKTFYVTAYDNAAKQECVLRSTDGGTSYDSTGFPFVNVLAIAESDPTVMVGLYYYSPAMYYYFRWEIYNTTDAGATWAKNLFCLPIQDTVSALPPLTIPTVSDDRFFAIHPRSAREMFYGIVYYYDNTNNGTHDEWSFLRKSNGGALGPWNKIGEPRGMTSIRSLSFSPFHGDSILAFFGNDYFGNISLSTDGGVSWTQLPSPSFSSTVVDWPAGRIYGANDQGVWATNDWGNSWKSSNGGLYLTRVSSLVRDREGDLFCVTDDGIYKWDPSLVATERIESAARNFALGQNYSNPFNAVTTISFSIPLRLYVTLRIFDVLGNEVTTLVSEEMQAGNYTRQWDATGLRNGVYFYGLQAGKYSEMKKMVVMK